MRRSSNPARPNIWRLSILIRLPGSERLTRQQILERVPRPDGVRIGFAAPGEAGAVTTLLKAAADDLEAGHLEALARGECGTWLLDALAGAGLGERLVRAGAAGELQRAAGELSLPLVARDGDGQVVGALLGVPSGTVVSGLSRLPGGSRYGLASMLTYAKIKAVAVADDARRRGIGAAMLARHRFRMATGPGRAPTVLRTCSEGEYQAPPEAARFQQPVCFCGLLRRQGLCDAECQPAFLREPAQAVEFGVFARVLRDERVAGLDAAFAGDLDAADR